MPKFNDGDCIRPAIQDLDKDCWLNLSLVILFVRIRYEIMLKCWEEQPTDRPKFEKLRKTMREMEKNHKVRKISYGVPGQNS